MKSMEAKAKLKNDEELKRKKDEEEKKKKEEEAAYADYESDHHGRIYIDYRLPRPNVFPVSHFTLSLRL
jgi:hypothetical protein